jgi:hypothetical protein
MKSKKGIYFWQILLNGTKSLYRTTELKTHNFIKHDKNKKKRIQTPPVEQLKVVIRYISVVSLSFICM